MKGPAQLGLCLVSTVILLQQCVTGDDHAVQIGVYIEALCPDSKAFVKNQLWPTYQKVSEIFNVTFVPFGNANFTKDGDQWKFHCQHGPRECLGNTIQACALNHYPNNVTTPFISCAMSGADTVNQSEPCAEENGLDWQVINECVNGDEGNELLHQEGLATQVLTPKITWVPWITVNGTYTTENEDLALNNFVKLVCDNYQGPDKPSACIVSS